MDPSSFDDVHIDPISGMTERQQVAGPSRIAAAMGLTGLPPLGFRVPLDVTLQCCLDYQRNVMDKRNMTVEYVRKLSHVQQLFYTDGITKRYGHEPLFRKYLSTEGVKVKLEAALNACMIGNLAHLSKYDLKYRTFLDQIRELPTLKDVMMAIP
jgi:hypothetical protein